MDTTSLAQRHKILAGAKVVLGHMSEFERALGPV